MSVPCESTAHSHDCSCHDCTAYSHDSPQTPRLRSITTILLNFSILHIWVHLQLSLPPHAKLLLERDHVQSILLEPTMASDPQSTPQPRLQPCSCYPTLTMGPLHRWPGCIVGGRLGGLSSNHSAPAALSTAQVFLGTNHSAPAALTGYRGNHLSVATANLAADLHLACEPCILLASLGPTTADLAMISAFVFVCAPPTSQAIGGRHCS